MRDKNLASAGVNKELGSDAGKTVQQAYPSKGMPGLIVDGPRSPQEAFAIRGNPTGEAFA
jgi:hypothetical protein